MSERQERDQVGRFSARAHVDPNAGISIEDERHDLGAAELSAADGELEQQIFRVARRLSSVVEDGQLLADLLNAYARWSFAVRSRCTHMEYRLRRLERR